MKNFALAVVALLSISVSQAHADEITCYKENGEIEYYVNDEYYTAKVSKDGKIVTVHFEKLTAQFGDDLKQDILVVTFTNTRCTIKYGTRQGLWRPPGFK